MLYVVGLPLSIQTYFCSISDVQGLIVLSVFHHLDKCSETIRCSLYKYKNPPLPDIVRQKLSYKETSFFQDQELSAWHRKATVTFSIYLMSEKAWPIFIFNSFTWTFYLGNYLKKVADPLSRLLKLNYMSIVSYSIVILWSGQGKEGCKAHAKLVKQT